MCLFSVIIITFASSHKVVKWDEDEYTISEIFIPLIINIKKKIKDGNAWKSFQTQIEYDKGSRKCTDAADTGGKKNL